jgi:hypothetical protein
MTGTVGVPPGALVGAPRWAPMCMLELSTNTCRWDSLGTGAPSGTVTFRPPIQSHKYCTHTCAHACAHTRVCTHTCARARFVPRVEYNIPENIPPVPVPNHPPPPTHLVQRGFRQQHLVPPSRQHQRKCVVIHVNAKGVDARTGQFAQRLQLAFGLCAEHLWHVLHGPDDVANRGWAGRGHGHGHREWRWRWRWRRRRSHRQCHRHMHRHWHRHWHWQCQWPGHDRGWVRMPHPRLGPPGPRHWLPGAWWPLPAQPRWRGWYERRSSNTELARGGCTRWQVPPRQRDACGQHGVVCGAAWCRIWDPGNTLC